MIKDMFGFAKKSKTDKRAHRKAKEFQAGCREKSASRRIREDALANARAAREHIGEDTIRRIAASIAKKENSPMARARAMLHNADSERVAAEILHMLDER